MADPKSIKVPPAFLLSSSVPKSSPIQPSVRQASTAEVRRLDIVGHLQMEPQAQPPFRRCDDCLLHLGRDVLRALGTCPRWGMPRTGVESRCPAFVAKAKDGAA